METIQNLPAYHNVFAEAMHEIVLQMGKDNESIAKKIMKHNIIYAFTMICTDKQQKSNISIDKKSIDSVENALNDMELDKLNWERLLIVMVTYQTLAGIKPTQTYSQVKAPIFSIVGETLKPQQQTQQQPVKQIVEKM